MSATKATFKKLCEKYWKDAIKLIGPYRVQGTVIRGYQRGREIGLKTANLDATKFPNEMQEIIKAKLNEGVYIGYARIDNDEKIYKTALSIGTAPHYDTVDNVMVESHILHKFDKDFYNSHLRVIITGFIRPSLAFETMDDLMKSVHTDLEFAEQQLEDKTHLKFMEDDFMTKTIDLNTIPNSIRSSL